jgi:probable addiction module antidote protein
MTTKYALFDASRYLDSDEMVAEYLTACAEDENPDVLLAALADVAKARGMRQVAEAAGLGRESLYKTLAPGARPRFHTVQAILKALNVRLGLHVPVSRKLAKAPRKTSAQAYEKDIVAAVAAATKHAAKKAAKPPRQRRNAISRRKSPSRPQRQQKSEPEKKNKPPIISLRKADDCE